MERAWVAGATGYTGREVVAALRARGVKAWAHVRPDTQRLEEWRGRFGALGAEVDAVPWEPGAMAEALRRVAPTHVFALLGTTRKRAEAEGMASAVAAYERVDYGLTKLLYDAATETAPKARFVYLSSIGVQPDVKNDYLRARAKVEAVLVNGPLGYTVCRPSMITGPDRDEVRRGERIAAGAADGLLTALGWVGGGRVRDRYASMTGQELAERVVVAALSAETERKVLDAAELRRLSP